MSSSATFTEEEPTSIPKEYIVLFDVVFFKINIFFVILQEFMVLTAVTRQD